MNKKYLFWIITAAIFLLLYHPVLTTYFTQDDFFHFKVAQTDGSFKGLLYLIGFHPFDERGIAFYRPLFRDLLYHISYYLFNLNQYPLRILSFVLHITNGYLVFKLIQKLFHNKFQSYFAAFFYVVTASNVATLYYLAGGIQVLGALMLILLTLLSYLEYLKSEKSKYLIISYITFILALSSHEQSFILPFLILGLTVIFKKKIQFKKTLKLLLPSFMILAVYLFLNFYVIGYSKNEAQYQILLNPKRTVNSLIWYSGWAMGLPEMLQDFAPSLIKLDPRLMQYWGDYFRIILPAFFISLGALFYTTFSIFLIKKKLFLNRKLLLLIFWYLLGLAPVIFLPSHKSGHYLSVVLPAFWGIIGYVVSNYFSLLKKTKFKFTKIITALLIISLLTLSSTSAILGKDFYWAATRGKLAEKLLKQITEKYPTLPDGSVLFIKNDPNHPFVAEDWGSSSKQASFILNGSDAVQLTYKNDTINVIYEDLLNSQDVTDSEDVYPLVIKIY